MNAVSAWLAQPGVPLALAAWSGTGLAVGLLIGWWRNRLLFGAVAGMLLGPIGWVLAWLAPGRFRECPACTRPIRVQAERCRHCGADVTKVDARSSRSSLKGSITGTRQPW